MRRSPHGVRTLAPVASPTGNWDLWGATPSMVPNTDMVLSILSLTFTPGEDGMGRVEITLAGDGAIALEVEAVNAALQDVTRPYVAPSRKAPEHGD